MDENLVETLFAEPLATVTARPSSTTRGDCVARVVAGGFPPALRPSGCHFFSTTSTVPCIVGWIVQI